MRKDAESSQFAEILNPEGLQVGTAVPAVARAVPSFCQFLWRWCFDSWHGHAKSSTGRATFLVLVTLIFLAFPDQSRTFTYKREKITENKESN